MIIDIILLIGYGFLAISYEQICVSHCSYDNKKIRIVYGGLAIGWAILFVIKLVGIILR